MKHISKLSVVVLCLTSISLFGRTVGIRNRTPYTIVVSSHTLGASKDIKNVVLAPGDYVSTNALADLLTSITATTQNAYQKTADGEHVEKITLGTNQIRLAGGGTSGIQAATTTDIYVAQGIDRMRVLDTKEINTLTPPQAISGSYGSAGQSVYSDWSVYRSYNFPVVNGKKVAQEVLELKWNQ